MTIGTDDLNPKFLCRRSNATFISSLVCSKSIEVTCAQEIANTLNNHFTTAADKVLKDSEHDHCKIDNEYQRQGSILSPLYCLPHMSVMIMILSMLAVLNFTVILRNRVGYHLIDSLRAAEVRVGY